MIIMLNCVIRRLTGHWLAGVSGTPGEVATVAGEAVAGVGESKIGESIGGDNEEEPAVVGRRPGELAIKEDSDAEVSTVEPTAGVPEGISEDDSALGAI